MEINDKDLLLDRCRRILESEAAAIKSIPLTDGYAKAVELIVEKVNRKGESSSRQVWARQDKSR